mgnify:FL=1|jgi:hypothetical protein
MEVKKPSYHSSYMKKYRQTEKGREVHNKSCKKYLEANRDKINKRRRERYLERKIERETKK